MNSNDADNGASNENIGNIGNGISNENIGIVVSSFQEGERHRVRLERRGRIRCPTPSHCQHFVEKGLYEGVYVAKPGTVNSKVKDAHVVTDFITHLVNNSNSNELQSGKIVREKRGVSFWLMNSRLDKEDKTEICSEFMYHLLQPENFPLNRVGYIKMVIWLMKQFTELRRVELSFELMPEPDTPPVQQIPLIENYITVLTPAKYDYQFLPEVAASKRTFVQFKVKSGGGASLALGHVYGLTDRQTYEIILGDENNRRSRIRYGGRGEIVADIRTPNILDVRDFVHFWVDWSGGGLIVGRGEILGRNLFLAWENIPPQRRHGINLISVSGSPVSPAQWEFVEYIEADAKINESKGEKRRRIRKAVAWYAKQRKMMGRLEEAFPASLDTTTLLRQCNMKFCSMLDSVMFLKSVADRSLVVEEAKGVWRRLHTYPDDIKHEFKLVSRFPRLSSPPTVLIITSLYYGKMAADSMFDEPPTSYLLENRGRILLTIGKMAGQTVVITKLPNWSTDDSFSSNEDAQYVSRLIDHLPRLKHIFVLAVGGAVPHYADFDEHLKRGDVIVSYPRVKDGATYIVCTQIEEGRDEEDVFYSTLTLNDSDEVVSKRVEDLVVRSKAGLGDRLLAWDRHAEKALSILGSRDERFFRPPAKSDTLIKFFPDGTSEVVPHHLVSARVAQTNRCRVKAGVIGSGYLVGRIPRHRVQFADENRLSAYDPGRLHALVERLSEECHRFEGGATVVLGIADYEDGCASKSWQPFAALMASAVVKTLLG